MAITTDLYSILRAYANKNKSPYIKIVPFLDFLGRYAARMAKEQSEWAKWAEKTESQFWNEITECTGDGRCVLMSEPSAEALPREGGPPPAEPAAANYVYMSLFYVEKIQEAYKAIDNIADVPFPNENSLNITIPKDQLEVIHLETDLASYFESPTESYLPILKMRFPDENLGSILVLAPMLPRRLLDASMLKLRQYLLTQGNKEHAVHRLTPQLSGNEDYVRENINRITIKPSECVNNMEFYGDGAYFFWSYFCAMLKNDIKKQREKLAQDIAVLEAAYIIDICNSLYKYRAQGEREREAAFRSLDQRIEQPPYYYSLTAITKFTNKQGGLLLGKYSGPELEAYIRKKTTESLNNEVPEWLIIQGEEEERWFIQKDKYLPLAGNMLTSVRSQVKKGIIDSWIKVIREFEREEAMNSDTEFDRLLTATAASAMSMLMLVLQDDKLFLVYKELERSPDGVPPSLQLFDKDRLLPMSSLLQIKRQDLLLDAKLSLPFWYSMPIFTPIIAFFFHFGKKKKLKPIKRKSPPVDVKKEEQNVGQKESPGDKVQAAREIAARIVPQGRTLDDHLAVMQDRWGGTLKDTGREHLVEDVNALIRDNLHRNLQLHKNIKITREALGDVAEGIISGTPALQGLRDKNTLKLYMELYMVKLLLTGKA
ncbi:hypothetical protein AGMMS49587_09170 [Spirochaetia bacterium]|nr:hypothetical protein AGMMS49587_09170 [Spirochaetia bacterium]